LFSFYLIVIQLSVQLANITIFLIEKDF